MRTKFTLVIISFFLSNGLIWSQSNDETRYNEYKTEVGINIRDIFSGRLGTGVIYKKRFKFGNLVARNEKTALRVQFGGSGQIELNEREKFLSDSISPLLFSDIFNKGINLYCLVGVEWQKQKNRFQYFYGIDIGYRISRTERLVGWSYRSDRGYTFRVNEDNRNSIPLIGFAGIKYFISPRIALAIDSGLEVNYEFGNTDVTLINNSDGTEMTFKDLEIQNINFGFKYLNMLNLSYYF